jgi:hypothetical protein
MADPARRAHDEGMDAYELTRPILTSGRLLPRRHRPAPAPHDLLAEAARYVHQLPLGVSPGPAFDRRRPSPLEATAELERALWRVAHAFGACVDADEPPTALARRLVWARAIVAPAADGLASLLPTLAVALPGDDAAVRLAERLVGYLDHRALRRR